MSKRLVRVQVVEVPIEQQGRLRLAAARDVLPWADPYIARLIIKHRLECDLADRSSRQDLNPDGHYGDDDDRFEHDRFQQGDLNW